MTHNLISFLSLIVLGLLLVLSNQSNVYASENIIQDTFTDKLKVNEQKTTTELDTALGEVRLPRASLPNAIALSRDSQEYAVITSQGVNFYIFDLSTGKVKLNTNLSITDKPGVKGIAMQQAQHSIWLITETELLKYEFDINGGKLKQNNYLSLSGMQGNISISAYTDKDKVVILSKDEQGKRLISTYQSTTDGSIAKIQQQSFNSELDEPNAIAVIPGSDDLILSASNSVYCYSFDINTSSYKLNQTLSLNTTSKAYSSICGKSEGFGYACGGGKVIDFFLFDSLNQNIKKAEPLCEVLEANIVSLSIKPGCYEYAALLDTGRVVYYKYDAQINKMSRVCEMEVDIHYSQYAYKMQAQFQTICFNTSVYDEIKLEASLDTPPGTKIDFYFSGNQGVSWNPINANGQWIDTVESNKLCIKAELISTNSTVTPKIFDYHLTTSILGIQNVQAIEISGNFPEQTFPTNLFPVKVRRGGCVMFTAETTGNAESLTFEVNGYIPLNSGEILSGMEPLNNPTSFESNTWIGQYAVPITDSLHPLIEYTDGWIFNITITAERRERRKAVHVPLIIVESDIFKAFDIKLSQ